MFVQTNQTTQQQWLSCNCYSIIVATQQQFIQPVTSYYNNPPMQLQPVIPYIPPMQLQSVIPYNPPMQVQPVIPYYPPMQLQPPVQWQPTSFQQKVKNLNIRLAKLEKRIGQIKRKERQRSRRQTQTN